MGVSDAAGRLPVPAYKNSGLAVLAQRFEEMLADCRICPRTCGVDRLSGNKGFCGTGKDAYVYSHFPHPGEEPPISGHRGSGTIFFSGCSMRCVYCQNYKFSRISGPEKKPAGRPVAPEGLADIMLDLQEKGCHNINLVTPGHVLPQIIRALVIASCRGLNIPLVYNTGGYDLPETIRLLESVVDVYLADMRYASEKNAVKYSMAPGYPEYNLGALKEMCRQRPAAVFDEDGIMRRGVIIRHLVLPEDISGTREVFEKLSGAVSPGNVYVSLMSQYMPCGNAADYRELSRRINAEEYAAAAACLKESGFENGWVQEDNGLPELAGINIKERTQENGRT